MFYPGDPIEQRKQALIKRLAGQGRAPGGFGIGHAPGFFGRGIGLGAPGLGGGIMHPGPFPFMNGDPHGPPIQNPGPPVPPGPMSSGGGPQYIGPQAAGQNPTYVNPGISIDPTQVFHPALLPYIQQFANYGGRPTGLAQ